VSTLYLLLTSLRRNEANADLITAMKIAKERKSSVLASNAVHHRIDSLTSIVALIAIGGAHFFHNAAWLDPVGGLVVSFMVIRAGWGNTGTALLELADISVDADIKKSVRRAVTKALDGDESPDLLDMEGIKDVEIRDIQGVKAGQNYLVDIELGVPGDWSVDKSRVVEDAVRLRVGNKVRGVRRVKVRFSPKNLPESNIFDEFIGADISPRSSPEPEDEAEAHGHSHEGHDHGHEGANGVAKKKM
jgi:divalent metal cation (Fe/Co/Zn/Cd) transporter